jgi:single-strand DNA-binding protein
MKKGINRVIIMGALGNDPETRYTPSGDCVVNISVATSENWKDKNTGEQKEVTEWHRCTAYRKTAEIISQHFAKGSKIYIEGKLQTRSWEQDGIKRYATEIIIEEFQFVGEAKKKAEAQEQKQQSTTSSWPESPFAEEDLPF